MLKNKIPYIIGGLIIGIVLILISYCVIFLTGATGTAEAFTLVIESYSAEKEYDGTPLVKQEYIIKEGQVEPGHSIRVEFTGSQLNAGQSQNLFTVVIKDGNDDVTSNYKIDYHYGDLKVNKRNLSITTASEEKIYDGKELRNEQYTVTSGTIALNQRLDINFVKSITNIGSIYNEVIWAITDYSGNDVSQNYDVKIETGELTVKPREITIVSNTDKKEYDGLPLTGSSCEVINGSLADKQIIVAKYLNSITDVGTISNVFVPKIVNEDDRDVTENYIITKVEGKLTVTKRSITITASSAKKEYDGTPLVSGEYIVVPENGLFEGDTLEVEISGSITNVGSCENIITSAIIKDAEGINVTKNYTVEFESGILTVTKRQITISTPSASKEYDGTQLKAENAQIEQGQLAEGHNLAITYTSNLVEIGSAYNTIEYSITDQEGNKVNDNYDVKINTGKLTITKKKITIKTDSNEANYNGEQLKADGYSITGGQLPQGFQLLPTYTQVAIDVGTYYNTANVLIQNALGEDMSANYLVEVDPGQLIIRPRPITIITGSAERDYDGTPLTCQEYSLKEPTDLVVGQRIDIVLDKSQTYPGYIENTHSSCTIFKDDINVTDNYRVQVIPGKLTIYSVPIYIVTESAEKEYDGTPLTNPNYTVVTCELAPNQQLVVDMVASITDAGSIDNMPKVRVLDENGNDITKLIGEPTINAGILTVKKKAIKIRTASDTKIYDGTPLEAKTYEVISGGLITNHTMTVTFNCTPTDVIRNKDGNIISYENKVSVLIKNSEDKDVTNQYQVDIEIGQLTINPRQIKISTESATKVYDGTPLTCEGYTLVDGTLVEGHTIIDELYASLTEVGDIDNDIKRLYIKDANLQDVTHNYQITNYWGRLKVTKPSLVISTGSATKFYDGTPLTCHEWKLVSGTIGPNVTIDAQFLNEITNAGNIGNDALIKVFSEGVDITNNFQIEYRFGDLTVNQIPITIRSGSQTKEYDGTPLVWKEYEILGEDKLLPGDIVNVNITGTITKPGTVKNHIESITIINAYGEDVTENYNIDPREGDLTITKEGEENIDNKPLNQPIVPVFEYTSDYDGTIYARQIAYSKYFYKGFAEPNVQQDFSKNEVNPLFFTSSAMKNAGAKSNQITIKMLLEGQQTPYPYFLKDYIANSSDYKLDTDFQSPYALNFYPYDYLKDGFKPIEPQYSQLEEEYYTYVVNNYLQIPKSTKEQMLAIANNNGLDANSPTIIKDVAHYIRGAARYNLDFEKFPSDVDMAVYFLTTAREGICQHFATSATMMFRALGIPSRYTVGYMLKSKANETIIAKSDKCHAWVEVYIKGMGWVNVEVTGSTNGQNNYEEDQGLDLDQNNQNADYHVKPIDVHVPMNIGIAKPDGKLQGLKALENAGYTYECVVSGEQVGVGKSYSYIEKFILRNANGDDVTNKFKIELKKGILQVYQKELTLKTGSFAKEYDGRYLNSSTINVELNESELLPGHYWDKSSNVYPKSFKDVGKRLNKVDVVIRDETGADVTDMYYITTQYGYVEITPRELTITSSSAEKEYDEEPLFSPDYTQVGLVNGDTLEVIIDGEQIDVGESENKIRRVKVTDNKGKDITSNYKVILVNGKLTVTI